MDLVFPDLDPFQIQTQAANMEGVPLSDLVMLVCAVLVALAAGVMVAYGACIAMFGLFRMHAKQIAPATVKSPVHVPGNAEVVEG
jgi:hypothetical protein